jgi:hypothetical protein
MRSPFTAAHGQSTIELSMVLGLVVAGTAGALATLNPSVRGILQRTTECVISDLCIDSTIGGGSSQPGGTTGLPISPPVSGSQSECEERRTRIERLSRTQRTLQDAIDKTQALIDSAVADRTVDVVKALHNLASAFVTQFRQIRQAAELVGDPKLLRNLYRLNHIVQDWEAFDERKNVRDTVQRLKDDVMQLRDVLREESYDAAGDYLATSFFGPVGELAYKVLRLGIDVIADTGNVYVDSKTVEEAKVHLATMKTQFDRVQRLIEQLRSNLPAKCSLEGPAGGLDNCHELPLPTTDFDVNSGGTVKTPALQPTYQRLIAECPVRIQNPAKHHQTDGCSVPPLGSAVAGTLLQFRDLGIPDYSGDFNEPFPGVKFSDVPLAIDPTGRTPGSVLPTKACDLHDQCYQTPGSNRQVCDQLLRDTAKRTCQAVLSKGNPDLLRQCNDLADVYYAMLRVGGEQAYEEDQVRNSLCCNSGK